MYRIGEWTFHLCYDTLVSGVKLITVKSCIWSRKGEKITKLLPSLPLVDVVVVVVNMTVAIKISFSVKQNILTLTDPPNNCMNNFLSLMVRDSKSLGNTVIMVRVTRVVNRWTTKCTHISIWSNKVELLFATYAWSKHIRFSFHSM